MRIIGESGRGPLLNFPCSLERDVKGTGFYLEDLVTAAACVPEVLRWDNSHVIFLGIERLLKAC